MKFNIVDTESAYRRVLAAPDSATREAIFCRELVAPFEGLARIFGMSDGLTAFRQWNMSPEQFAEDNHAQMTSTLDMLTAADAWNKAVQALEEGTAAFAAYADRIPLQNVTFGLMLADMSNVPFQRGYTGFGGIPGWIMTVYGVPDAYSLHRVKAATVHELHHNILGAAMPKDWLKVTVADYMVMEGLAESFAAELYGEDTVGYYVTDFDDSRLAQTKRLVLEGLDVTGFNKVRDYIFGSEVVGNSQPGQGIPPFTGYALGYRTVQAYCKKTGKSVVEATFVPARTIITESGFFADA